MSKFGENGVYRTDLRNAKDVMTAVMWDLYFTHQEPFSNPMYVPQWKDDYDQIASWLTDNKGQGLILSGGVGNGKTMMIRSVIPYILRRRYGRVVDYCTAVLLDNDDEVKRRKRFTVVLQAVDDLGTEDIRTYFGKVEIPFAMILDEVDQKGGLILASTNMSSQQLREKYGDRTFDRMLKSLKFIAFHGESLRANPLRVDKMDFVQQSYYNERLDEWKAWRSKENDEVGQRLRDEMTRQRLLEWRQERANECGLTLKEWERTKMRDEDYLRTLWQKDMERGGLRHFFGWLGAHGLPIGTDLGQEVMKMVGNLGKGKPSGDLLNWFTFEKPKRYVTEMLKEQTDIYGEM